MAKREMSWKETARKAQRSESGDLVYNPGIYGGDPGNVASDLKGHKAPKNSAEAQCFEYLSSKGWTVTKRGWPDFFCVKDGAICAVEVKPTKRQSLRPNQIAIMGELSAKGIKCYKWSPDGGFEEVKGMKK